MIRWRNWTNRRATGTGRAYPDHGSYPIHVVARRPVSGYFSRLVVFGKLTGRWHRDMLGICSSDYGLGWIELSQFHRPSVGCTPWPR